MSAALLVECARSWIGTPYHHHAKVKGAGVDCIQLLIAAHDEAGLITDGIDPGIYSTDWFLHRSEERYLEGVNASLRPLGVDTRSASSRISDDPTWDAPSGAVLIFRIGRTFSHGGIVSKFPYLVHASQPSKVVEEIDITKYDNLFQRPMRVFIHESLMP